MINDEKITVLYICPGRRPIEKIIDAGLKSLQAEVGGRIEVVYPFQDPVALICNDIGKMIGLPLNRALRDEMGAIYDVVAGTFLIVGMMGDSFTSLAPELVAKYKEKFAQPESFVQVGDTVKIFPMRNDER